MYNNFNSLGAVHLTYIDADKKPKHKFLISVKLEWLFFSGEPIKEIAFNYMYMRLCGRTKRDRVGDGWQSNVIVTKAWIEGTQRLQEEFFSFPRDQPVIQLFSCR